MPSPTFFTSVQENRKENRDFFCEHFDKTPGLFGVFKSKDTLLDQNLLYNFNPDMRSKYSMEDLKFLDSQVHLDVSIDCIFKHLLAALSNTNDKEKLSKIDEILTKIIDKPLDAIKKDSSLVRYNNNPESVRVSVMNVYSFALERAGAMDIRDKFIENCSLLKIDISGMKDNPSLHRI